jgi:hypothetical protein
VPLRRFQRPELAPGCEINLWRRGSISRWRPRAIARIDGAMFDQEELPLKLFGLRRVALVTVLNEYRPDLLFEELGVSFRLFSGGDGQQMKHYARRSKRQAPHQAL